MNNTYVVLPVQTKADLVKKIEIERENLVYFEYMQKEEAYRQARKYVEEKYADIVQDLRAKGLY